MSYLRFDGIGYDVALFDDEDNEHVRTLAGPPVSISTATTTTVLTSGVLADGVYLAEATFAVSNDTDDEGALYIRRAAFKVVSGTITQIGATTDVATFEDAGQGGLEAVIDSTSGTIRARFTTDAADTVIVNPTMRIWTQVLT